MSKSGAIFVADVGRGELLRFPASGDSATVIGRPGGGPGEFASMFRIGRFADDSILVYDGRLSRLSVFSDSAFVRSTSISTAPGASPFALAPVGLLPNGRLLMATGATALLRYPGPARVERETISLHAYSRDGKHERSLGTFEGQEYEVLMMRSGPLAGEAFSRRPRTFGRGTAILVSGDHIVVADNDAWRIDFLDGEGALTRSVRFAQPAVAVTQKDVEAFWEERLAGTTVPAARNALRAIMADVNVPELFPAFDANVLVSQNGDIWIGDFVRPGTATQRWRILKPDGTLRGQLTRPAKFRLLDAGERYVLALVRDEDGVETIELHELETATEPVSYQEPVDVGPLCDGRAQGALAWGCVLRAQRPS